MADALLNAVYTQNRELRLQVEQLTRDNEWLKRAHAILTSELELALTERAKPSRHDANALTETRTNV
jgi:hypothetical protein